VLNASPQERRLLLEEAAGLARHKRRRAEALRRLEQTAVHLQRVQDLLDELDAQHARLAEQADAARRHRAFSEEVRSIELGLIADEARRLRQAQQRYAQQTQSARARLAELEEQARAAAQAVAELQRIREELAHTWEAGQRQLVELVRTQAAAETAGERATGHLAAHQGEEERLRMEIARLAAELQRAEADGRTAAGEVERLEREVQSLRRDLQAYEQAERNAADALLARRAEADALERRRAEVLQARGGVAGRAAAVEARRQVLERQAALLVERRRRLEEQLAAAEAETGRLRTRVADARAARDRQGERVEATIAHLRALGAQREALAEEIRTADARRHRLEARLQALEEAGTQLLGYEEGARTLLLAKRSDPHRFTSILGALVDQIAVEPQFRAAVEAALGRRLYCLLTRDTAGLRDALAFLRADGRGPVSFLPLDRLAERHPNGPPPDGRGVLGSAAGFVTAKQQARSAVDVLLGDVVVVEDLDVALRLLAAGHRGRAVTLAGELVSPDGVITVRGMGNGKGSPLSRRSDLDQNRSDQAAATATSADLHARESAVARETQTVQADLAVQEKECTRLEQALATEEAALAAAERERTRLPAEIEEVRRESAAVEVARTEAEGQGRRLGEEASSLEGKARDLEPLLTAVHAGVTDAGAALDEERRRGEDLRVRLAEVNVRRQAAATRAADLAAAHRSLLEQEREIAGRQDSLAKTRRELEAALDAARREQERAARAQAELEAAQSALDRERTDREAAHAAAQEAVGRVQEEARAAEAALHRAEVRAAQADAEWGAVDRRLQEVGLAWPDAEEMRLPLPREEARGRLAELRELILQLGPVNLRAIDEQETLAARIDRLRRQVEDIEGARLALQELLERLDAILRVRFRETFQAVSLEFGRLFVRLFEGGAAHLELVQETPEADPGLEVVVRLPGKPPQSLAALSGGERVLVALALLFAMLRVHPSPFCVFDEVEAALDDANTRRFALLLREVAASTQIIIITHNKGTMEAADILYGVTMQEPGVSSILSVRLGERNGPSAPTPQPVAAGQAGAGR